MPEFPWTAYNRWLEPPSMKEHSDYGCSACSEPDEDGNASLGCNRCHEFNVDCALSKECPLCVSIMEEKILTGWICELHPRSYCEPSYCEGCVMEKENQFKAAV